VRAVLGRLERQVSRQAKLEQSGADPIGDDEPHVLALPEGRSAFGYRRRGTSQGVINRSLPIGKLDTVPVGNEGAVVQVKMVLGDLGSLRGELNVSQAPTTQFRPVI
jgi:hypothetical protein